MDHGFRAGEFRARFATTLRSASVKKFWKQAFRHVRGMRDAVEYAAEVAAPRLDQVSRGLHSISAPVAARYGEITSAASAGMDKLNKLADALTDTAQTGGRRVAIESLEGRRLFSAAPTDYLGTVSMGADPNSGPFGALNESATLQGSNIVCQINGVYASFPASQVQLIKVWGSNVGGDTITIDHAITAPAIINAGNGGHSTISGGGGADTIQGWGGHNSITAGTGHDQISGQGGYNTLIGGTGGDTLTANGGNN